MQADLRAIRALCGEKERLRNSVYLVHPVKKTNAGTAEPYEFSPAQPVD